MQHTSKTCKNVEIVQDSCANCGKKAYCVYVCDEPKLRLFQYHPHPYRMRLE